MPALRHHLRQVSAPGGASRASRSSAGRRRGGSPAKPGHAAARRRIVDADAGRDRPRSVPAAPDYLDDEAGVTCSERVDSAGSFMHLPNLVFHEAGHILFTPLGRFMIVLGGSLTQVLVPLVCAGAFLWQTRDPFGAAIAVWWAGESLTDVAPYINDARDLQLVLLGGKTGAEVEGHDWEYLLTGPQPLLTYGPARETIRTLRERLAPGRRARRRIPVTSHRSPGLSGRSRTSGSFDRSASGCR